MEISKFQCVNHVTHTIQNSGTQFGTVSSPYLDLGLSEMPEEWKKALEESQITKEELEANTSTIFRALYYNFHPKPELTKSIINEVNEMLHDRTSFFCGSSNPQQLSFVKTTPKSTISV